MSILQILISGILQQVDDVELRFKQSFTWFNLYFYNGSPVYPDSGALWRFAKKSKINHFGHGAVFYQAQLSVPPKELTSDDFSFIKTVGSTGSPLIKKPILNSVKFFLNHTLFL